MYREKLKKKQGNYRWEKPSKAVEEKKLAATIKGLYENSVCIGNLCVQTKIMIRTKRTYPLSPSTPVIYFSIAEKLQSLCLWNCKTFGLFLLKVLLKITCSYMSKLFSITNLLEVSGERHFFI